MDNRFPRVFADRDEAGRLLAAEVRRRLGREAAVVLGLPRGGVPIAVAVAEALDAPVDVLVVRKVGAPFQPELAMGAVAGGGIVLRNEDVLAALPDAAQAFDAIAESERAEVERRELAYRGGRPALQLAGRTVVLVDDGAATGATIRVAIAAARAAGAARIVVAVPVASREALALLEREADDVVCLEAPRNFDAVGNWYGDFPQLSDAEVQRLLK